MSENKISKVKNEESYVKGYKVFNPDWTCNPNGNPFQYAVGGTYKEDVEPMVCSQGFHFCEKAVDCFNYYSFDPKNKIAEVIALGKVDSDGIKSCTNKIKIVREIKWAELLEIANTGKGCTGYSNSGYRNSGGYNSGDYNSGDWNSGDWNSGNGNSGNWNSGNWNSGNRNSGDWNSGDYNSGDWNSGNRNSGDWNSGNRNSGDWNSGNCNSGDSNSGDWNKCSFSNGCFNTLQPKMNMFNKPSNWTYQDWQDSEAYELMKQIKVNELKYIYFSDMTNEEKAAHPEAEVTGGYLKTDNSEYKIKWWRGLSNYEKDIIKSIPNFDKNIFKEITGIDVDED